MYNGIGLQTARGSGTNGYVQTNKFFIRSRTGKVAPTTRGFEGDQGTGGITKKPNSDILEHDRKRQIELKLVVLEDKLIDQGFTDAEIAERVEEARNTLEAAAASKEHGGHGAFMLGDSKASDTQSHQIAARKEKQMETLRAALGIAKTTEADEQHADMSEDGLKYGGKWGQKPEHSFLDRDISWKKSMVEDPKGERDDKKRGVKNLKNKKKEDGANDTKRSKKNEYRQRKGRRTADDTGSDSDRVKKKKLKKHKKSRRDDSDSDDSSMEDDTDSDSGKRKSKTSKNRRKSKRYSSDSYDSSTEDEKYKKPHKRHDSDDDSDDSDAGKPHLKQAAEKFYKSSRRHDSDDSDTDKPHLKQAVKKIQKSSRRHDSDDSDTDKPHLKQAAEKIHKSSRRHDSDDSDADKPHLPVVERIHKSSRRHDSDDDTGHQGGNCPAKVPDYDVDDRWKGDEVHMKSSPKYIGHGKSDKERKLSKELTDKSKKKDHSDDFNVRKSEKGRGRRHASDDDGDDSDTSYGRISLKKKMGRHAIERKLDSSSDDGNSSEFHKGSSSSDSGSSDSDHSHGKAVKKDPVGGDGAKNTGGRSACEEKSLKSTVAGADDRRRQRNSLGDDLHNSRGDAVDTSGYSSRAMMSSKRKLDDTVKEEQEESKSRNRSVGEESGRNRDRWPERDESGSKTRSYQSKNDQRRDDYSNSVKPKGRGDEDVDFKDRSHHKDDEHGSKNYSAHEKNAVEKKLSKGEGDQKGRNYERYEEGGDQHRRHGKDDWNQQQTSGKLGRGEDEQREGRGHEREKRITRDVDNLGERRYQRDEEGGDVYKKSGKDGDQERVSHRRGRGEDEHRGSRSLEREKQIIRDEDDQGGRRYERDQEGGGVYKRSGKHDGDEERGSHRRVGGEDEQRGSRGFEREKQITWDGDDQGERRYQRDEVGGDANKRSVKDDGEQERGSHKHGRGDDEQRGSGGLEREKRITRDGDDQGVRMYQRYEVGGGVYKRFGKDGAQERGSYKRGRGEEEARGGRGYNRDKEVDYSKKGRYDDHRSSERTRYERD